ncbi:MAG: Formate dehydrogenase-O, major subunit protein [Myxococcaceae bacterium]|nr:Formate dehydrogenase-O, major subunit protein [Myxococcaceae bacterium]
MPATKVTFCRICEASCGLVAEVEDNRVLRLLPDREHVVSRGFACVKGTNYTEVHASPDRVQTPLKRVGERFEPISWEQALSEIGGKVRSLRSEHGVHSVGAYLGNPAAFSLPHVAFAGLFVGALGTRNLYTSGSQDCNNKFVVAEEMFGSPLLQPIPDLDRLRCFIVVGSNPAVSQLTFVNAPRLPERLKALEHAGCRVVFVNPRRTESAAQCGEQLFIRPGSDVFFFLAFAHELLARGAVDPKISPHVRGLSALREVVRPWPPERVAAVTGIAPSKLRELVSVYAAADGAALYAGTGVNQGPHGTLSVWLLTTINVLSGNLDRRGGMLLTKQQRRTAKLSYPSGTKIVHKYSRIGGHRSVLDSLPAALIPDEILTPGEGQLRALFVSAGNPVLSCPNSARMHGALSQLELIVSIDLFRNETGNLAHYILPATSFLERSDLPMGLAGYQPVPYAQWVDAVVTPLAEARDEWWIFAQLASACGAPLLGSRAFQWLLDRSLQKGWPTWLRFSPQWIFALLAGAELLSLRRLRRHPHGLLLAAPKAGAFVGKTVPTKDGKIELAPQRFLAAAGELEREHAQQTAAIGRLRLIGKRERTSHNSWMHNVERFVHGGRDRNYLYMHPDDAAARGLIDGARCQVSSQTGRLEVHVKLSPELMPGAVALPHGWGHQAAQGLSVARETGGVNANLLSADGSAAVEPLSGMARLTAIEVEVSAMDQEAVAAEAAPSPEVCAIVAT